MTLQKKIYNVMHIIRNLPWVGFLCNIYLFPFGPQRFIGVLGRKGGPQGLQPDPACGSNPAGVKSHGGIGWKAWEEDGEIVDLFVMIIRGHFGSR